ncbi:MAG: condensin complex protein MksE [Methylococcaceae bacterium]
MSHFADIAKQLINGKFICEYSHSDEHAFLLKPGMADEMTVYLEKMEFTLSTPQEGNGFYCSYLFPKDNQADLKKQFTEVISSLSPLVSFLTLVQQSSGDDDIIRPGDILRMTEIQGVIEDTTVLSTQLDKIVRHSLFRSTSPTVEGKLKQIFNRLIEMDYLVSSNPAHQIYTATSKWSLLIDQIRFINDTEQLSLESLVDETVIQGDLYD